MSDVISALRREVLEGHRRHQQRSRLQRVVQPVHPRSWRPAAIVAAAAAAAAVFVAATVARHLIHPAPEAPRIVGVRRIGGLPTGAAYADGSVWVGDYRGSAIRVDPRRRRLLGRSKVRGQPEEIIAGAGALWVRSPDASGPPGGPIGSHVTRIDPSTLSAAPPIPVGGGNGLAAGSGALWVGRRFTDPEDIERIDPARNAVVARIGVSEVDGLAAAGTTLWAHRQDGSLVEIDASSDQAVRTFTRLAPGSPLASAPPGLVADAGGIWTLSTGKAALLRVQSGEVVRTVPVSPDAQLLARTPTGMWIATSDPLLDHNRVVRLDPDTGKATGALDLGHRQPIALVAAGGMLCVVTSGGELLLIR